jgi:hypothetical protein
MSKLPLKVTVGIRDHWSKKDSDVQKSLDSLEATLGIGSLIEPDWPVLLADLDKLHPDKSTFVPSVTECAQAFSEALNELAEHESMAEWSDTLLEKAEGKIRASIEVSRRIGAPLCHSRMTSSKCDDSDADQMGTSKYRLQQETSLR